MNVTVGDQVVSGGAVLARGPDGRVLFVDGALPGETVEVRLVSERRDFARGEVRSVLDPSPERVIPPCPHARAGCGGCQWQHIDVVTQLHLKERIVSDALRRIAGDAAAGAEHLPAVALPAVGYRTTVRLAAIPGVGAGRLAYRRRRTQDLLVVDSCDVAHARLAELIATVEVRGWREVTLRVGVSGGQRLAVPARAVRRGPRLVRGPADLHVVDGDGGWITEDVAGRTWRVSARSFFQAGPVGAEALVAAVDDAVADALPPGGTLVDAYAGVGLLGGAVAAARSARLHSVESLAAAVADARHNLSDLDATVTCAEVGAWRPPSADVVIADPARSGLGRPGAAALAATGAARIVLVSCDPASFARDTGLLVGAGYRLSSVRLVDLFPHTVHVETVSRFDRR